MADPDVVIVMNEELREILRLIFDSHADRNVLLVIFHLHLGTSWQRKVSPAGYMNTDAWDSMCAVIEVDEIDVDDSET